MPAATTLVLALDLALAGLGLLLLARLYFRPQSRRAAPALPPWDISLLDFFLFLWLAISVGIVAQFFVASFSSVRALEPTQRGLLINGAGLHIGIITGVFIFAIWQRGRFTPNAPGPTPINIFLSGFATFLIAFAAVGVTGLIVDPLLKVTGLPLEKQDAVTLFRTTQSPVWRIILTFLAVCVAPVSEELIFRAGIFRFLRTRVPRWLALALSACLFALLHGNLASFFQLAVLAFVLSLAYERTGKIGTSIIAHGLFNLHTALLLLSGIDLPNS